MVRPLMNASDPMAGAVERDSRTKRLHYRAWRRGTLEMDLLLGRFADSFLDAMDEGQLDRFERLLDQPDPDIHAWVDGRREVPEHQKNDIVEMILNFHKTS